MKTEMINSVKMLKRFQKHLKYIHLQFYAFTNFIFSSCNVFLDSSAGKTTHPSKFKLNHYFLCKNFLKSQTQLSSYFSLSILYHDVKHQLIL